MLSLMSGLGNFFLASMIYSNKELQAHPYTLVMYIAIADGWNFFIQFNAWNYCALGLNQLLAQTFQISL